MNRIPSPGSMDKTEVLDTGTTRELSQTTKPSERDSWDYTPASAKKARSETRNELHRAIEEDVNKTAFPPNEEKLKFWAENILYTTPEQQNIIHNLIKERDNSADQPTWTLLKKLELKKCIELLQRDTHITLAEAATREIGGNETRLQLRQLNQKHATSLNPIKSKWALVDLKTRDLVEHLEDVMNTIKTDLVQATNNQFAGTDGPNVIFVGGPFGSGKTSSIAPWLPIIGSDVASQVAYEALQEAQQAAKKNKTSMFVFDSSLATLNDVATAQQQGLKTDIRYFIVPPEVSAISVLTRPIGGSNPNIGYEDFARGYTPCCTIALALLQAETANKDRSERMTTSMPNSITVTMPVIDKNGQECLAVEGHPEDDLRQVVQHDGQKDAEARIGQYGKSLKSLADQKVGALITNNAHFTPARQKLIQGLMSHQAKAIFPDETNADIALQKFLNMNIGDAMNTVAHWSQIDDRR